MAGRPACRLTRAANDEVTAQRPSWPSPRSPAAVHHDDGSGSARGRMLGCRCSLNEGASTVRPGGCISLLRERVMRRMILVRAALAALAPVLLHALAREADRGLGLVLRAEVEPDGSAGRGRPRDGGRGRRRGRPRGALGRRGNRTWLGLAVWRRWREGTAWADALAGEAVVFTVLLLRPAMTIVALLSVATRASYPYGFTLPVALTQDWAIAQDVAVLAALVAWRPAGPPCPGPARGRGVRPRLPRVRPPRARLGVALGGAPGERAQVPAAGGGARPRADVRRRGGERRHGGPAHAAALRVGGGGGRHARSRVVVDGPGSGARRCRPPGDPGRTHHAADDPGQGGRSLLRARARPVADARAGAARRPGDQPLPRPAGAGCGQRPRVVRARRSPRDGALPAGARRDGSRGAGRGAFVRVCAGAAVPLLFLPVLPGDGGGAGDGRGLPDAGAAAGGPAAAPLALRRDAGGAAVAAPEVPAGLAGARGHGAVRRPVIPRSFDRVGSGGEAPSLEPRR